MGRPPKYDVLLNDLDDDELYSPASIVQFALQHNLLRLPRSDTLDLAKRRLRVALARLSHNHRFPLSGDGLIVIPGQGPRPAWFGWRWKQSYR